MVRPFPHEPAHEARVLVEGVDVLLDIAWPIAHGVDVLAEHKRLVPVLVLAPIDDIFDRIVHPALNVC